MDKERRAAHRGELSTSQGAGRLYRAALVSAERGEVFVVFGPVDFAKNEEGSSQIETQDDATIQL